ncbi:MAG: hypothetical protein JXR49_16235 [Acidobacteria bacterium]|nr:hypothetical protein [Acidobacteriota bacterium]
MKDLKTLEPFDFLKILWKRKWYAVAVFILTIGASIVYSQLKPDLFRSSAMIQVEEPPIPSTYVRPPDASSTREKMEAIRQLIESRTFLERLIQEFQLYGYGTEDDFLMENAIRAITNNIIVQSTSRNTFTVSFIATDAQVAQSFTRRIVDMLIQSGRSTRKFRAMETDQFLDEQLRQVEQKLTSKEEEIKDFKSQHIVLLPPQASENARMFRQLKEQLEEVNTQIEKLYAQQKVLDAQAEEQTKRLDVLAQNNFMDPADLALPGTNAGNTALSDPRLMAKEAELEALLLRYTPSHPDVHRVSREVEDLKRQLAKSASEGAPVADSSDLTPLGMAANDPATEQIESGSSETDWMLDMATAEIKIQAEKLNNEVERLKKMEADIVSRLKVYEDRIRQAPIVDQQLGALERQRNILERQYGSLMSDKFQAQLTSNLETSSNTDSYKVIDEANLPEKPVFPDRKQMAIIGFGAAFILGIGAAFGRELFDSTLSTEEEASAVLKVPVLVSVYEIPSKHTRKRKIERLAKSA